KKVVESIKSLWNITTKRKLLIEDLGKSGFKLIKKAKRNKKIIDGNMWKEGLKKQDLNACDSICDSIKTKNYKVVQVEWNDLKNDYLAAQDKQQFIEDFQGTWFKQRDSTVAKKQKCSVDEVIHKRTKFLLLGYYLISTDDKNSLRLKYYHVCYKRFNELHETIGDKILLLPMPTAFFTAH
ncbi:30688_t:CDS:2, partial [Racocetra persica]